MKTEVSACIICRFCRWLYAPTKTWRYFLFEALCVMHSDSWFEWVSQQWLWAIAGLYTPTADLKSQVVCLRYNTRPPDTKLKPERRWWSLAGWTLNCQRCQDVQRHAAQKYTNLHSDDGLQHFISWKRYFKEKLITYDVIKLWLRHNRTKKWLANICCSRLPWKTADFWVTLRLRIKTDFISWSFFLQIATKH